jgi:hypothetical protein
MLLLNDAIRERGRVRKDHQVTILTYSPLLFSGVRTSYQEHNKRHGRPYNDHAIPKPQVRFLGDNPDHHSSQRFSSGGPTPSSLPPSDVLSASRNGSRLLLLLMSRKPLQTASSSITGHQDGDELSKKIISTLATPNEQHNAVPSSLK